MRGGGAEEELYDEQNDPDVLNNLVISLNFDFAGIIPYKKKI